MNDEPDPHHGEPTGGSRPETHSQDAAERAVAQAKRGLQKGVDEFKQLNRMGQVYLGGLAVVVVFGLLFDVASRARGDSSVFGEYRGRGRSLVNAGWFGQLAYLAAVGGIVFFVWNLRSSIKPSWVPKVLAGCAGAVVLLMFAVALVMASEFEGEEYSRTILGFWLPFLGAAAATWVSLKPLLDAWPKGPATRNPNPPPPPPIV